jgi:hypothetical protein
VGSYPTLSTLTYTPFSAPAGLLSVAVVVASPLPEMRPHFWFRGATFQFCEPGESREVPLLAKTSSDGFFHFDDQLLIYRVGGLRPATTKDSLL